MSEARQQAEEVIERAKQEVFAICKGRHHGGHEWRMSIPVNEERDSDRIIMAGLNAANDLLAAEVQRAVAEKDAEIEHWKVSYYPLKADLREAQAQLARAEEEKQRAVDEVRISAEKYYGQMARDYVKAALDGEQLETARAAVEFFTHEVDGLDTVEQAEWIDKILRARQRAGGYDPEIGYFDAWKGSD